MTTSPAGSLSPEAEALVLSHRPLARSVARRFAGRSEALDDLEAVAALALVAAASRYDPDRGVAFATYATVSITGELKRHFRDRTWSVRVPRSVHNRYLEIREAQERLPHEMGRSPTIREIADDLGCGEEDVLEALEAQSAHTAASLDAPTATDGQTVGDRLGHEDPRLSTRLDRAQLQTALTTLDQTEQTIVSRYFFDDLTQLQIAQELGVSQMQVSRLLARALRRLRHRMTS